MNALEKHNCSIIVVYMNDRASKNNLLKEMNSHLYNQALVSSYNAEMLISFLATFKHLCNRKSSDPCLGQYVYFCWFDAQ
jgi:hypothetical protein